MKDVEMLGRDSIRHDHASNHMRQKCDNLDKFGTNALHPIYEHATVYLSRWCMRRESS